MKRFFERLSSMSLAVWLLAYLVLTCILATLIPQGLAAETYEATMPRLVAKLVTGTGFDHFFSSMAFLMPVLLLFVNLSACTIKRFIKEIKKKRNRKHGPDILHLGLVFLVIGAVLSFSGYKQGSIMLSSGEKVTLPDGAVLKLHEFRFERYDDGRPKDWVSLVSIEKNGQAVKDNYELRVNHPLRYKDLTFYQMTYKEKVALALFGPNGERHLINQGEWRNFDTGTIFFIAPSPDGDMAMIRISDKHGDRVEQLAKGGRVGAYISDGFVFGYQSGLEASSDPGYPMVLISLLLIALGTAWAFLQKLRKTQGG
ncbi:hypothetical protein MASR2M29_22840 [Spirochaetota bacterium]